MVGFPDYTIGSVRTGTLPVLFVLYPQHYAWHMVGPQHSMYVQ